MRQFCATDVLRDGGAADVQTIVVAVGHVAQWHAIKREAQLVLLETANRDADGPLVGAIGVSRLEVHAWQLRQDLQRAGARDRGQNVDGLNGLDLASFATAIDDDFFDGGIVGGGCGGFGLSGEGRCCTAQSERGRAQEQT